MAEVESRPCPKVELHVHLDGAVRAATVFDVAKRRGISVPGVTADDLRNSLIIPINGHLNLTAFLQKFSIFMPVIAGDAESIKRMAYEWCEDCHKQNIIYSEVRYCPHLLANSSPEPEFAVEKGRLTPRDVIELINLGLAEGSRDFNVTTRSLLACMRHKPEWSQEMLDFCNEFRDRGVVGIDIAGDENLTRQHHTSKEHVRVFQQAERLGINRTVHAGENGTADNVREAVDKMRCRRLGHGYHTLDDENLYQRLLKEDVHFETCPYSSVMTTSVPLNFSIHPLIRFMTDKANCSINTDDPLLTGKSLQEEYNLCVQQMGLSDKNIAEANFNALKAAFIPDEEKRELHKVLTEAYGQNV